MQEKSPKTAAATASALHLKDIIALVTGPEAEALLIHVGRGLEKREEKGDSHFQSIAHCNRGIAKLFPVKSSAYKCGLDFTDGLPETVSFLAEAPADSQNMQLSLYSQRLLGNFKSSVT